MNSSARSEAIQLARQWLSRKPVYIDTETTGTGPNDSIIEISIIDQDGGVLVESLVRPVGKISPGARAVHGITDDMIKDAPLWESVWKQAIELEYWADERGVQRDGRAYSLAADICFGVGGALTAAAEMRA